MAKINILLFAFILITFVAFKAALIPGSGLVSFTSIPSVPSLHIENLTSAFNQVSDCNGLADCVTAIGHALVALLYFIGELLIAIFWVIIDIFFAVFIFIAIGFEPINGAPIIINAILSLLFGLGTVVIVAGFFTGD